MQTSHTEYMEHGLKSSHGLSITIVTVNTSYGTMLFIPQGSREGGMCQYICLETKWPQT